MIKSDIIVGIVAPDLLVVSAIDAALADVRANPWLLDYCFQWLSADDLTQKFYGSKEIERAKDWILKHQIFVTMATRPDDPKFPIISVNLQSSMEDYATLGDVNSITSEEIETSELSVNPQIILGPFTAQSYNRATGLLTLPSGLSTDNIFVNMIMVDTVNNVGYKILNIVDDSNFQLDTGLNAEFVNAYIAPIDSFFVTSIESLLFKQTYSVKCLAQSEPIYASYLATLVQFLLLRYKEILFEARGFDRSTISVGPLYWAKDLTGVENTYGQDITLSGYARYSWPKAISPTFNGIKLVGINSLTGTIPPLSIQKDTDRQGWGTI